MGSNTLQPWSLSLLPNSSPSSHWALNPHPSSSLHTALGLPPLGPAPHPPRDPYSTAACGCSATIQNAAFTSGTSLITCVPHPLIYKPDAGGIPSLVMLGNINKVPLPIIAKGLGESREGRNDKNALPPRRANSPTRVSTHHWAPSGQSCCRSRCSSSGCCADPRSSGSRRAFQRGLAPLWGCRCARGAPSHPGWRWKPCRPHLFHTCSWPVGSWCTYTAELQESWEETLTSTISSYPGSFSRLRILSLSTLVPK